MRADKRFDYDYLFAVSASFRVTRFVQRLPTEKRGAEVRVGILHARDTGSRRHLFIARPFFLRIIPSSRYSTAVSRLSRAVSPLTAKAKSKRIVHFNLSGVLFVARTTTMEYSTRRLFRSTRKRHERKTRRRLRIKHPTIYILGNRLGGRIAQLKC